jgi:prevent-host-death family protein
MAKTMKTFTATEAKNQLGAVMDAALAEPVAVKKSGRVSVVILAASEYERLTKLEDAHWAARAALAKASGFADADEVAKLIEDFSA